jgi:excisionase family DNA binding protein
MGEELIEQLRTLIREELGRPQSPWLSTEEAAEYIGSTAGTLKAWRSTGQGPAYHTCNGRLIRYERSDLDRFVRTGER